MKHCPYCYGFGRVNEPCSNCGEQCEEPALALTLGDMDGGANRVYYSLAPSGCSRETNLRAFSYLCGAAAAAAVRFGDEIDFGRDLTEEERAEWEAVVHVLMRLADEHCAGSTQGEPGDVAQAFCRACETFRYGKAEFD